MSQTLFDRLVAELQALMEPVIAVGEDPTELGPLLYELGVAAENPGVADITAALTSAFDLVNQVEAMADNPSPSFDGIAHLLDTARQAVTAVQGLNGAGGAAAGLEGLGEELVQLLVGVYLARYHPMIYKLGILLTFIDTFEDAQTTDQVVNGDTELRAAVTIPRFRPERLVALLRDPEGTLRAFYGNPLATGDDAHAMADKLFPRIGGILTELDVSWRYGVQAWERNFLGDAVPLVDHSLTVFASDQFGGDTVDAGVTLTLSPATEGDLGLVVCPFGALTINDQFGRWTLALDVTAEVEAFTWGRHGFNLVASPSTTQIDASFSAKLAAPDNGPAFVFGAPNASRLEIGGAEIDVKTTVSTSTLDLAFSAAVSSSKIVIAPGDGDGFLAKILPAGGLEAKFNLGVAWSNHTGLSFRGSAGLEAALPVGLSIGGVLTVPTIYLGLAIADAALVAEVSASVGLSIGPVKAVVDHIGLTLAATFPDSGGSLGVADLGFAFRSPSGVGLAVDAAGVSGGGFLRHDDANHEYSGVLQLQFADLALQAFGLITTQVAGAAGYSLLALVDAEFPPVQLGWGFTLNGVGGLVAVNRTASVDALRAALKADQLSAVLFPKNAITNAPQILGQIDALFPTAQGRFLFGPMALIGWGTPTVLTAAIAVILELPEPVRILLLARVAVRVPTDASPVVRITMDALGVLDFGKGELDLDATLFDSRLVTFTLSGNMALRANWQTDREFLLAVGGFHPSFSPPAGFPALQRITIDMPSGAVSKLRLSAYLAITSNTVQFGANLDVFIGVSGYGLAGHLGFDALLQLDPLLFVADISGRVALMAGGDDLMSVGLDATLSGPAPWHIAGKFSIHIVFFDVTISFSHSWGDEAALVAGAVIDVAQLLGATFADPRSWDAQLPSGVNMLVALRQLADPGSVLAHPLGVPEVHERIVPLGLAITRFGDGVLTGATQFNITGWHIGGSAVNYDAVQDDFAPAQFFDLTDDEKLARPSFERHDAGARMAGALVKSGASLAKTIAFETYFIEQPGGALRTDTGTPVRPFPLGEMLGVLAFGSAGRTPLARASNRKYTAPGNPVRVAEPRFVVVDRSNLAAAGVGSGSGANYSEAQALLYAAQAAHGAVLEIVATHETAAA